MAGEITVVLEQVSATTSEATVRDHKVLVDRPIAKEGTDQGPMGGEYMLVALGGCFMSNLLAAVRSRHADISEMRAEVRGTLADAPPRYTDIELRVSARHSDRAQLEKLVTISERACICANTLRGSVNLTVTVE